jgi:hypothetical protein
MKLPATHPAVWDEFDHAIRYYTGAAGTSIALDFEACVYQHFGEIKEFPLIYCLREDEIRRVNLGPQFKEWYLAFMLWNQQVIVVALGHAKRRPYLLPHPCR